APVNGAPVNDPRGLLPSAIAATAPTKRRTRLSPESQRDHAGAGERSPRRSRTKRSLASSAGRETVGSTAGTLAAGAGAGVCWAVAGGLASVGGSAWRVR